MYNISQNNAECIFSLNSLLNVKLPTMMRFLNVLLLLIFLIPGYESFCQEIESKAAPKQTIYIVRHGEKSSGNDPVLSEAGLKRAGDLYRFLKDVNIDKIYSTPYKRTMMTGDSLRIYNKIDTLLYKADVSGDGFIETVKRNFKKADNILVIGHSNTIAALLRKIGAADNSFKDLEDNEYNNIYIVHIDDSKITLEKKKYGSPNPELPAGSSMKP
jgi:phosphohistidine phosphatase SixA